MKRDYILQKRPVISRSLLIVATPYIDPTPYLRQPHDTSVLFSTLNTGEFFKKKD